MESQSGLHKSRFELTPAPVADAVPSRFSNRSYVPETQPLVSNSQIAGWKLFVVSLVLTLGGLWAISRALYRDKAVSTLSVAAVSKLREVRTLLRRDDETSRLEAQSVLNQLLAEGETGIEITANLAWIAMLDWSDGQGDIFWQRAVVESKRADLLQITSQKTPSDWENRAAAQDPSYLRLYILLARLQGEQKQWETSTQLLERALAYHPTHLRAKRWLDCAKELVPRKSEEGN